MTRGVLASLFGNGVYVLCQWLYIVLLARLGSIEVVGEFAFALAVTAPMFMFANLGLRFYQATDAKREWPFSVYLYLRLITVAVTFVLMAAVAVLLWLHSSRLSVVLAVAAHKAFEAIADIHYGLYQQQGRNDLIAVSLSGGSLLSLVFFTVLYVVTRDVTTACIGMAVGKLLVLGGHDVAIGIRLGGTFQASRAESSLRGISELIRASWPLGVVAVLGSLATNIPRYAVEDLSGEAALGIFAGLSYLLFAGMAIARSVSHPYLPLIAADYQNGDRHLFFRHLGQTVAAGMVIGIIGVVLAFSIGDLILEMLYGSEYLGYSREFTWVMVAATFAYMGLAVQYGLTAMRSIRSQAMLIGTETIIVLAASWLLVTLFGILGGALTMALGAAFEFFGGLWLVWFLTRNLSPKG